MQAPQNLASTHHAPAGGASHSIRAAVTEFSKTQTRSLPVSVVRF